MKLSDALRGAADRAPIEQMQVSTADAAGRVKRERALRMGGNGLVGAGAVVVLAIGAMGPLGANGSEDSALMAPAMDGGAEMYSEEGAAEDSAAGGADTRLAEQWMCGSDFDPNDGAWAWGDASGVTYTAGEPERDGDAIMLPATLEAHRPVNLISGSDYVVTWEGIVVGRMVEPSPLQYGPADKPSLPEGEVYERLVPGSDFETLEHWVQLEPVNCWDGEPLPAADYDVHQAWTLAYAEEDVEPVEPSDEPDTLESEEAARSEESTLSEEALPEPGMPELFRVAAGPVSLTIDGERVDDPFADYLGGDTPVEPVPLPEPIKPEPLPEGHLTPDLARELYEAGVVEGAWDMAGGTQRWVRMSDSTSTSQDEDWNRNYYGCSWDGQAGSAFPEESAELELLDVDVDLPSSIGVSYGFVVDGNPRVDSTVTNVSEYTIPGYWSADPQLYLVRDGSIVAEAYPTNINRDDMAISALGDGTLAPGASVAGQFLWRDVSACNTDGGPGDVEPGTYTVLTMQSINVANQQYATYDGLVEPLIEPGSDALGLGGGDDAVGDGLARSDVGDSGLSDLTIGGAAEPGMEILPAPDQMDWIELQAWTSLGTVNLTTS